LCEVARELAERELGLEGEQVVGWDKGKIEISEMYNVIHTEIANKMQQCINIYYSMYMKLNMFRATNHPSSGAQNCTSSLWFCIRERLLDVEVAGR